MKVIILKFFILCFITMFSLSGQAKKNIIATSFSSPTGIAFNLSGDMYVTNWSGDSIVKISANGKRETIYKGIASPAGIIIDQVGNIYVSSYSDHYILRINIDGAAEIISEGYHTPTGIALSNSGQLLVTNRALGQIVSLDLKTGEKRVITEGLNTPVGVTQLEDGSLVVSQYSGRLTLIRPDGQRKELGADFNRPGVGIVTESKDTVVVIDNGADSVRRVNVITGKTELLIDKLPSAVALSQYKNRYYVGSWGDNAIHFFDNNKIGL